MIPARRELAWGGWLSVLALLVSCSRQETAPGYPPPPGIPAISVMSYNLNRFCYDDRDLDGQTDDFKPEAEMDALARVILRARPDILAVQEIGDASALHMLRQKLAALGLDYPHADHLPGPLHHRQLGLLSRYPVTGREPLTHLVYTIKDKTWPVQSGYQQVDLAVGPATTLRLVHVHLKSKDFHEAGQTEMRRNEARLLATHLRRWQRDHPGKPLLVCGDFSDTTDSAALRELTEAGPPALHVLPLSDDSGHDWTYRSRPERTYYASDFFLANGTLQSNWLAEYSGIIGDPDAGIASDHRPIMARFRASD